MSALASALARRLLLCSVAAASMACADGAREPSGVDPDGPNPDPVPGGPGPVGATLRVHPENPRYFADSTGAAVLLTGSHHWWVLQEKTGATGLGTFDYEGYLDFLESHGHNFMRLWTWEHGAWAAWTPEKVAFEPLPYQRTGPGLALDGLPRYDLTRLDPAYFDRLRERVVQAGERGIYVSVMLFQGFSVESKSDNQNWGRGNPWPGHPFHGANNVNGIDADRDGDGEGREVHTLADPEVVQLQEAYVRRVVETLNDLDNVLWEISNESRGGSEAWQFHMIRFIRETEAGLAKRHPVGMTYQWPDGAIETLAESPADWISPGGGRYRRDPPEADGRKVSILDTDHICALCSLRQLDEGWVWRAFLRGHNVIFMDPHEDPLAHTYGNLPPLPDYDGIRSAMGRVRAVAATVDLARMEPDRAVSSSGYALADATPGEEAYLVYVASGRDVVVNLSPAPGPFRAVWLHPSRDEETDGGVVEGGALRELRAPFRGAVLSLRRP